MVRGAVCSQWDPMKKIVFKNEFYLQNNLLKNGLEIPHT